MRDKDSKVRLRNEKDKDKDELKQYVTHFSQYADLVEGASKLGGGAHQAMIDFAKGIRDQVQVNKVKLDLSNQIKKQMIDIRN